MSAKIPGRKANLTHAVLEARGDNPEGWCPPCLETMAFEAAFHTLMMARYYSIEDSESDRTLRPFLLEKHVVRTESNEWQ